MRKKVTAHCRECGRAVRLYEDMVGRMMSCPHCKKEFRAPLTTLNTGLVCADYWLQRELGTGRISDTFLAKKMSTDDRVALKVFSRRHSKDPDRMQQMLVDMCRFHNVEIQGFESAFESGRLSDHYYIATRYVDGKSLARRVKGEGAFHEDAAVRLGLALARRLRKCWQTYRIAHGAIHPDNIILDKGGDATLINGGCWKGVLFEDLDELMDADIKRNITSYLLAEPESLSPQPTFLSDIYALAASLYYAVSGVPPKRSGEGTFVSVRVHNPEISKAFAKLLLQMLGDTRTDRLIDWAPIVKALKKMVDGKGKRSFTTSTLKHRKKSEHGRLKRK